MKDLPLVSIIVAMDSNNLIGNKNNLPWHIPGELQRFKRITMGKAIIMGRKTHNSIGKILEGRMNIILSKNSSFKSKDAHVFNTLDDVLEKFTSNDEIFIIGGEEIFKLALPITQKIYMTKIHKNFKGDTWFPKINEIEWKVIDAENHFNEEKQIKYSFLIYERINE